MPRILGGRGRGRRLRAPGGLWTRPTGARVRQALFDILAPDVAGSRFLDLFAGAGAVGLEAASRGAATVVLVDASGPAVEAIRTNARELGGPGHVEALRRDARSALSRLSDGGRPFDLVFLDPPYDSALYEPLIERLGDPGLLARGGCVVAQHFHKRALPERIGALVQTRSVRIGDHRLSFYRRGDEPRSAGA